MANPRGNPNPTWIKGGPSPNPSGRRSPDTLAARSLAFACREAATDQEIAEWLLTIASGRWPEIRASKSSKEMLTVMHTPPGETTRLKALDMFLLRRDGQPMQAVVLQAQLDVRGRMLASADDVIDVEAVDTSAARVLEVALTKALQAGEPEDE